MLCLLVISGMCTSGVNYFPLSLVRLQRTTVSTNYSNIFTIQLVGPTSVRDDSFCWPLLLYLNYTANSFVINVTLGWSSRTSLWSHDTSWRRTVGSYSVADVVARPSSPDGCSLTKSIIMWLMPHDHNHVT